MDEISVSKSDSKLAVALEKLLHIKQRLMLRDAFQKLIPMRCLNKRLQAMLLRQSRLKKVSWDKDGNNILKIIVSLSNLFDKFIEASQSSSPMQSNSGISSGNGENFFRNSLRSGTNRQMTANAVETLFCELLSKIISYEDKIEALDKVKRSTSSELSADDFKALQDEILKLAKQVTYLQGEKDKLNDQYSSKSKKLTEEIKAMKESVVKYKSASETVSSKCADLETRLQASIQQCSILRDHCTRFQREIKAKQSKAQSMYISDMKEDLDKRTQEILSLKTTIDSQRQDIFRETTSRINEKKRSDLEVSNLQMKVAYLENSKEDLHKQLNMEKKQSQSSKDYAAQTIINHETTDILLSEEKKKVTEAAYNQLMESNKAERLQVDNDEIALQVKRIETFYKQKMSQLIRANQKVCLDLKEFQSKIQSCSVNEKTSAGLISELQNVLSAFIQSNEESSLIDENQGANNDKVGISTLDLTNKTSMNGPNSPTHESQLDGQLQAALEENKALKLKCDFLVLDNDKSVKYIEQLQSKCLQLSKDASKSSSLLSNQHHNIVDNSDVGEVNPYNSTPLKSNSWNEFLSFKGHDSGDLRNNNDSNYNSSSSKNINTNAGMRSNQSPSSQSPSKKLASSPSSSSSSSPSHFSHILSPSSKIVVGSNNYSSNRGASPVKRVDGIAGARASSISPAKKNQHQERSMKNSFVEDRGTSPLHREIDNTDDKILIDVESIVNNLLSGSSNLVDTGVKLGNILSIVDELIQIQAKSNSRFRRDRVKNVILLSLSDDVFKLLKSAVLKKFEDDKEIKSSLELELQNKILLRGVQEANQQELASISSKKVNDLNNECMTLRSKLASLTRELTEKETSLIHSNGQIRNLKDQMAQTSSSNSNSTGTSSNDNLNLEILKYQKLNQLLEQEKLKLRGQPPLMSLDQENSISNGNNFGNRDREDSTASTGPQSNNQGFNEAFFKLQAKNAVLMQQIQSMPSSLVVAQAEKRVLEAKLEKAIQAGVNREKYLASEADHKINELRTFIEIVEKEKAILHEKEAAQTKIIHQLTYHIQTLEEKMKSNAIIVENIKQELPVPPWHSLGLSTNAPFSSLSSSSSSYDAFATKLNTHLPHDGRHHNQISSINDGVTSSNVHKSSLNKYLANAGLPSSNRKNNYQNLVSSSPNYSFNASALSPNPALSTSNFNSTNMTPLNSALAHRASDNHHPVGHPVLGLSALRASNSSNVFSNSSNINSTTDSFFVTTTNNNNIHNPIFDTSSSKTVDPFYLGDDKIDVKTNIGLNNNGLNPNDELRLNQNRLIDLNLVAKDNEDMFEQLQRALQNSRM